MFFWLGNLLIAVSLGGLLLLAVDSLGGSPRGASEAASAAAAGAPEGANPSGAGSGASGAAASQSGAAAAPGSAASLPISRLVAPRISLEADVVPASLVEREGGTTWEVPPFKAGHAQHTAGAGQPGNAVLLGHVDSRNAGNVFADLDQIQAGDTIQILSGTRQFDYRVVEVRSVPRTDVSVLQPTETATISLITCTGVWLPTIWDYTERLVVRAELASPPAS